ncbi:MAG: hypothetical protein DME50_18830 [Verrucomicrobia bacterium]|nr:MAG: hypothetical protein DME50_18830 [Verrucomicrobiota bacterium]
MRKGLTVCLVNKKLGLSPKGTLGPATAEGLIIHGELPSSERLAFLSFRAKSRNLLLPFR